MNIPLKNVNIELETRFYFPRFILGSNSRVTIFILFIYWYAYAIRTIQYYVQFYTLIILLGMYSEIII